MTESIMFQDQESWHDFASTVHNEFGLNVMTSSSLANQIPEIVQNEGIKHALEYNEIPDTQTDIVVLDLLINEVALADGEKSKFTPATLDEALRKVVALYQDRAKNLGCHIAGKYLTEDVMFGGALLRVFRNQDFPCTGHPELAFRAPIGMYHCDRCGEMQLAGTFHLPKEETQNG